MSVWTECFDELYSVQTGCLGAAILATVEGYAADKPALLSEVNDDPQFGEGTTFEQGGYTLKMKPSDFTGVPADGLPKNTPIICNGDATDVALFLISSQLVNGIFYLTAGDVNAP